MTATVNSKDNVKGKTKLQKGIFIRQVRSGARTRGQHKKTLTALGLGKIGKTNTLPDNPAVRGMLRSVIQWLEVKQVA